MKDIMQQDLAIGNMVVFNPPIYKGLAIGTIVKFTAKMVTVSYQYQHRFLPGGRETNVPPTAVMKVDEQLQVIHLLRS